MKAKNNKKSKRKNEKPLKLEMSFTDLVKLSVGKENKPEKKTKRA